MTDLKKIIIDGNEVEVDGAMTLIQACEVAGIEVPRFCYHERLSIAGNCRGKIRTFEDRSQRVYSPPHLTALEPLLWGSVPLFNIASNNMRFIYFIYPNATRDLLRKTIKKRVKHIIIL
jgi:hypothetical protein